MNVVWGQVRNSAENDKLTRVVWRWMEKAKIGVVHCVQLFLMVRKITNFLRIVYNKNKGMEWEGRKTATNTPSLSLYNCCCASLNVG